MGVSLRQHRPIPNEKIRRKSGVQDVTKQTALLKSWVIWQEINTVSGPKDNGMEPQRDEAKPGKTTNKTDRRPKKSSRKLITKRLLQL